MPVHPNKIQEMAYDIGLERPKIAVREEWDSTRMCILSYGPLAYRQTMSIDARLGEAEVKDKLEAAAAAAKYGFQDYQANKANIVRNGMPAKELPGKVEIAQPPKPAQKRKAKK